MTITLTEDEPQSPTGRVVACLKGPQTLLCMHKRGSTWMQYVPTDAEADAILATLSGDEPGVFYAEIT